MPRPFNIVQKIALVLGFAIGVWILFTPPFIECDGFFCGGTYHFVFVTQLPVTAASEGIDEEPYFDADLLLGELFMTMLGTILTVSILRYPIRSVPRSVVVFDVLLLLTIALGMPLSYVIAWGSDLLWQIAAAAGGIYFLLGATIFLKWRNRVYLD